MAGQASSLRFVTSAYRDEPTSVSTEKEATIENGSLEGHLDGQDENEKEQNTADDPDAIHIPKWLRTNIKTVKVKETSTEWRDACKEYEAFPRELKVPTIPKFPQLRLRNMERKLILRTLGRAESRGEVPYESELDDAERKEVYDDVRHDLENIRASVKQAKRLRGGRNGERTLFHSIDWQEDEFELSNGMFWGRESDEDEEEEEVAVKDEDEEKSSEEQLSSKGAEALVAESESAKQVEVDEEMGEADDDKPDGSLYVDESVNSGVQEQEQDGHEIVAGEGAAAPVAGNETVKQVEMDDEMGEADNATPDGSLQVAEGVNFGVSGSESAKPLEVDAEMGEAHDDKPDGSLNVAGNVHSLVQEPDGHAFVANEEPPTAGNINSSVQEQDGHELVVDEGAATVNSLLQKQDEHELMADEGAANTTS
jgi:hypothetical protein